MEGGTTEVNPQKDTYEPGELVTLTARPSPGYVFVSWSGHTEGLTSLGESPASLIMGDREDNDCIITATFAPSGLRCTVNSYSTPAGGGSVVLQPAPPADGYPINQTVTVSASAETGYIFARWSEDLGGTENPRTILVTDNKWISAVFNPTITANCSPSEGGSLEMKPQSSGGYAAGTEVVITASAAEGYRFSEWTGDASGSDESITVAADSPKTITAVFVVQSPSRHWGWAALGIAAAVAALTVVALVFLRARRAATRSRT